MGPLPADSIFVRATRGEFDLVVSGYHDHGTGFDIAGQNRADSSSMIAAVKLAARLARVKALVPPSE